MNVFVVCDPGHVRAITDALDSLAQPSFGTMADPACNAWCGADMLLVWEHTSEDTIASAWIHRVREQGLQVPILVVAESWQPESVVRLLNAGADDCLVGTHSDTELRARLRALGRRCAGAWRTMPEARWRLVRERYEVQVEGSRAQLTPTQFSILDYLVRHADRWRTTDEIIHEVLGTYHQKGSSVVRFHIHKLRSALGGFGAHIRWERGKGYMLRLDLEVLS